jgi:hypothetical protein
LAPDRKLGAETAGIRRLSGRSGRVARAPSIKANPAWEAGLCSPGAAPGVCVVRTGSGGAGLPRLSPRSVPGSTTAAGMRAEHGAATSRRGWEEGGGIARGALGGRRRWATARGAGPSVAPIGLFVGLNGAAGGPTQPIAPNAFLLRER